MARRFAADGTEFRTECDLVDVTSSHRPDTAWVLTDAHGHVHRWFTSGQPATAYNPLQSYDVPSLVWVKDGEEWYDDDDEPHDIGHLECRECGEHIKPGYTADQTTVHIPGVRRYFINDESVSKEEFEKTIKLKVGGL